jgi:hypothetical protein
MYIYIYRVAVELGEPIDSDKNNKENKKKKKKKNDNGEGKFDIQ